MTVCNSPVVLQRADSWVFKVDDEYWFTASDPEYDKIVIHHTSMIDNLQKAPETVVWRKYESGICDKYIWAPELHRVNGTWYTYLADMKYEFEPDGMSAHRMFVLEDTDADPTINNWVEKGQIVTPVDSFSLGVIAKVIGGVQHLVWARKDYGVPGSFNLYIVPITNLWTLATDPVMLTKPKHNWECIDPLVNEGPVLLFHNDKIFITYSTSGTSMPYAVSPLTADHGSDLMDLKSWTKSPVPVSKTYSENDQCGPDHNSSTKFEGDSENLMIYHTRNYTEIESDPLFDLNHHARIGVIRWNEDGTPGFGMPEPDNLWTPITTDVLPPDGGPKVGTPTVELAAEA